MNNKGYTLIEMLISLIGFVLLLSLMIQLTRTLIHLKQPYTSKSFELAITQLQWSIANSNHLYKQDKRYCFDYEADQRCLNVSNGRLYLSPGTQIVLTQCERITLFEQEDNLWIKVIQAGKHYEQAIWKISQ